MVQGPGLNPIAVWCKVCRRKLLVRPQDAGKRARCAACGVEVLVPLMSESAPPPPPFGPPRASSPTGDETIMIERIGRRTGLIAGGVVVGVVLLAMVGVFGYMLLVSGPAAHSAEEEVPPLEPAVAPPAPPTAAAAAAPSPSASPAAAPATEQLRPAMGITFANRGEGDLDLNLEPAHGGSGIQRVLKPGENLTLGLQPGTYKARFGASPVTSLPVTKPEIWVFTSQQGAAGRLQWQRHVQ
ncbi:MAG TPA: hypothetical protein VM238_08025 [Phycisphaerae bacterium]|nr:hypothetical protein [Phycisphaerae bacterium]